MKDKYSTYSITLLPNKKLWWFVGPLIPACFMLIYYLFTMPYSARPHSNGPAQIILFLIFFAVIIDTAIKAVWLLTGKVDITVDEINMTVTRYFAGKKTTKIYILDNITDMTIIANQRNDAFLSFIRTNFMFVSYKNPLRVVFIYNGSIEKIGNYCDRFPASELRKMIYEKKHSFA